MRAEISLVDGNQIKITNNVGVLHSGYKRVDEFFETNDGVVIVWHEGRKTYIPDTALIRLDTEYNDTD